MNTLHLGEVFLLAAGMSAWTAIIARAIWRVEMRGRPRGGPHSHKVQQDGATPSPATTPPPARRFFLDVSPRSSRMNRRGRALGRWLVFHGGRR